MSQDTTGINRKVKGEEKIGTFLLQETVLYNSLFNAKLNQS